MIPANACQKINVIPIFFEKKCVTTISLELVWAMKYCPIIGKICPLF